MEQLQAERRLNASLIAAAPDEGPEAAGWWGGHNLTTPLLEPVSLASLHVSGTPTLLLVDRAGILKRYWVGQLSEREEAEVLSAVSR